MSRAPIISGTRKLAKTARIGTMTRKIIVVPCIVMTSLYEFFVRKCSFGVASCERMRSARIPPATNHMSDVAMYRIPIRLWSTVTSQLAMRPLFQPTGYTASDLAATCRSQWRGLVDVLLHVGDERGDLGVRPALADGRHRALRAGEAVLEDSLQSALLREEGVVGDRGPVAALAEVAVAGRADAAPLLLPERLPSGRGDVVLVRLLRLGHDRREHRRVIDAAELRALALVAAGLIRLEPEVVRVAWDGLNLAAERRDPPAVDDVRRDHIEIDDGTGRHVQRTDRASPSRVVELPVVLMALDRDVNRIAGSRRVVD